MVLHLVLVTADLLLHLVQGGIEDRPGVLADLVRDEIVLVLGVDLDLDSDPLLWIVVAGVAGSLLNGPLKVHDDVDLGDPLEIRQQLLGLRLDVASDLGRYFAVAATDFDMHWWAPEGPAAPVAAESPAECMGR